MKSFKFVPNPEPLSLVFFGSLRVMMFAFPSLPSCGMQRRKQQQHEPLLSAVLPFLHPVAVWDRESQRAQVQAFSQDCFIGVLLTKACNSAVGFSRELQLAWSMEPFRVFSISFVSRGPWMAHKKTYVNDHRLDPCTQSHNTVYCNAWPLMPFVIMYTGAESLVRHLQWTKLALRTKIKSELAFVWHLQ